jgi:DNA-binding NarL/FixJ family response regulator
MLPSAVPDLDTRTVEVLRLIADGAGTREISSELGYSERTIKTVIAEAVRGLGARNRAHAVAEAMRRALI